MKPLKKGRRPKTPVSQDRNFQAYSVRPEAVETSILLMESQESDVLCETLSAIVRFAAMNTENCQKLLEKGCMPRAVSLMGHEELKLRRLALKIIANLAKLPDGPEELLRDIIVVIQLVDVMIKSDDTHMLDFASMILAEVSREMDGCEQVMDTQIMSILFERMKHADPDVQKNCLQILSNILKEPLESSNAASSEYFVWAPILALLSSEFIATQQLALQTVDQLITRYQDTRIQETFRASTGFEDLMKIIECYEWKDLHVQVLDVLAVCLVTEENVGLFFQRGCVSRLQAYLEAATPELQNHCIAVFSKMASTINGREALYACNMEPAMVRAVRSGGCAADAARGVAHLAKHARAADRLLDLGAVEALTDLLSDESVPWSEGRLDAVLALSELCHHAPRTCPLVSDSKTITVLLDVLKKDDTPIEGKRLVAQCFADLALNDQSRSRIVQPDIMEELILLMSHSHIELKIVACAALSACMSAGAEARMLWSQLQGESAVLAGLYTEHVGLRTALCHLITLSISDEGAQAYVNLGALDYLIDNQSMRYWCTAWEVAIHSIFRHHLPAKFAYTSHLEINDITKECFYATRRSQREFVDLKILLSKGACPIDIVLVSCFLSNSTPTDVDVTQVKQSTSKLKSDVLGKAGSKVSALASTSRSSNVVTLHPPADPHLPRYLQELTKEFGEQRGSLRANSAIKQRARELAEFVVGRTCGRTPDQECEQRNIEMHLHNMKLELESTVIPLGSVRWGGACERALLYKVLADRTGVPCALRRAPPAQGPGALEDDPDTMWCEVALPDLDDPTAEYPAHLLRANYVVDLRTWPGALLRSSSCAAAVVRGEVIKEVRADECTCGPPPEEISLVCSLEGMGQENEEMGEEEQMNTDNQIISQEHLKQAQSSVG